ncbi:MAG: DUF2892 domain-containing protein [Myxococcales bacterium]
MTVQRVVLTFAGSLILISIALALLVNSAFLILTAFVGLNLLQSAYTGFCPLASALRALGLPDAETPPWARGGVAPR